MDEDGIHTADEETRMDEDGIRDEDFESIFLMDDDDDLRTAIGWVVDPSWAKFFPHCNAARASIVRTNCAFMGFSFALTHVCVANSIANCKIQLLIEQCFSRLSPAPGEPEEQPIVDQDNSEGSNNVTV